MTYLQMLDAVSIWAGRFIALLAVICGGLIGGCWLSTKAVRRVGLWGMLLQFAKVEASRDPRRYFARLFWGFKEKE